MRELRRRRGMLLLLLSRKDLRRRLCRRLWAHTTRSSSTRVIQQMLRQRGRDQSGQAGARVAEARLDRGARVDAAKGGSGWGRRRRTNASIALPPVVQHLMPRR